MSKPEYELAIDLSAHGPNRGYLAVVADTPRPPPAPAHQAAYQPEQRAQALLRALTGRWASMFWLARHCHYRETSVWSTLQALMATGQVIRRPSERRRGGFEYSAVEPVTYQRQEA